MATTIAPLIAAAIIMARCCSSQSNLPWKPYFANYQPSPDRYNYFDAELLEVLSRERGNVVISPLGVKLVLGMLLEGTGGTTAEEIEGALRIYKSDAAVDEIKQRLYSIQTNTAPDNLKIANRIFASDKLTVNPEYESRLTKNYGSDIARVRFSYPKETAERLNSWVAQVTSGKIKKLADASQISNNAKLILANAIYFRGVWQTPFSAELTITDCFYTRLDKCTMVPFMTDTGSYNFGYVPKLDAYAISLPYEGGQYSMILVLPRKKQGHVQLTRDMIHVGLDEILSHMQKEQVKVEIPRFAAEFSKDLVADLRKLHISQVFSNNANITAFLPSYYENASVANFFHSAKVEVDEQGTVAAAATGVLFVPLMGDMKKYFVADHPFLFFIRDSTGTVLFSGKVEEPQGVRDEIRFSTKSIHTAHKAIVQDLPFSRRVSDVDYPSSQSGQISQWPQIQFRQPVWNQRRVEPVWNSRRIN